MKKSKINSLLNISVLMMLMFLTSCGNRDKSKGKEILAAADTVATKVTFTYYNVTGIGRDSIYNRRDNSDIIKVGDTYYVWYSRMDSPITPGYWATIWYATSRDQGRTWEERGMALDVGPEGAFDHHSVFTPNILAYKGKYYLYYTGVRPTPGNPDGIFENNSINDFTAIGLAVAESPDGPFKRVGDNPVLTVSETKGDFDSYRIDDASMLVRDNKIWLYYKGRSMKHGPKGPGLTEMGVAYADVPEGPFIKHDGPILERSHEVLIWKKGKGVASLASIGKSINYAGDGIDFSVFQDSLTNIPMAPGLYRPDLGEVDMETETPGWGMAMKGEKGVTYLLRFEMK